MSVTQKSREPASCPQRPNLESRGRDAEGRRRSGSVKLGDCNQKQRLPITRRQSGNGSKRCQALALLYREPFRRGSPVPPASEIGKGNEQAPTQGRSGCSSAGNREDERLDALRRTMATPPLDERDECVLGNVFPQVRIAGPGRAVAQQARRQLGHRLVQIHVRKVPEGENRLHRYVVKGSRDRPLGTVAFGPPRWSRRLVVLAGGRELGAVRAVSRGRLHAVFGIHFGCITGSGRRSGGFRWRSVPGTPTACRSTRSFTSCSSQTTRYRRRRWFAASVAPRGASWRVRTVPPGGVFVVLVGCSSWR